MIKYIIVSSYLNNVTILQNGTIIWKKTFRKQIFENGEIISNNICVY